ncbi:exosome nuclease subunit [Savitreella phatthalungensis]
MPASADDLGKLVRAVAGSAAQLGTNDLDFHRSLDPALGRRLDRTTARLLKSASGLLSWIERGRGQKRSKSTTSDSFFDAVEDVDHRWSSFTDVLDHLYEQADHAMDEVRRPKAAHANAQNAAAGVNPAASATSTPTQKKELAPLPASLRNATMDPPQRHFARQPDNFATSWTPLIRDKVHARQTLRDSLLSSSDIEANRPGHPYQYEIQHIEYPRHMYHAREPQQFSDVEASEATWVDTEEKLHDMLSHLRKAREIAVDLEHHDFHSYRGFVCLMQVSDRHQDWIVDTLALRDELIVLNEVFADPTIVKVLHGATSDVVWLQRDFGLYLVNLFDTYHASRALGFESRSLAFLLQKYCGFDPDKRYQLADWRIRPLPKEMLYYARADTHYLLYIYDHLINTLLEHSPPGTSKMLDTVLRDSEETALRQYMIDVYDSEHGSGRDGWQGIIDRNPLCRTFDGRQVRALKALHAWRDRRARTDDKSTRFVLGNNQLIGTAQALPTDETSLKKACKPMSSTVQQHMQEVIDAIAPAAAATNDEQPLPPGTSTPKSTSRHPSRHASRASTPVPTPAPTQIVVHAPKLTDGRIDDLITETSEFWGAAEVKRVFLNHQHDEDPSLRLTLPIPELADKIYADASDDVDANVDIPDDESADPVDAPETDSVTTHPESPSREVVTLGDTFTVRDLQRRERASKRSKPTDTPRSTTPQQQQQQPVSKRARRESGEVAFDYASAPKVLGGAVGVSSTGGKARQDLPKKAQTPMPKPQPNVPTTPSATPQVPAKVHRTALRATKTGSRQQTFSRK